MKKHIVTGMWVAAALTLSFLSTAFGAPCDAPEYHQFDFWIGTWNVYRPDGKLVGVNRIEREYDGCVVHEHYRSQGAFHGESLNVYDAGRHSWHQTWVDNQGTLLLLEGGIEKGSMVLYGRTTSVDGKVTAQRITWTPNADGSVRQLWESSEDSVQWKTVFDGHYVRQAAK